MQQMVDEESKPEHEAMFSKIKKAKKITEAIVNFLPVIKVQLTMNEISQTDLKKLSRLS